MTSERNHWSSRVLVLMAAALAAGALGAATSTQPTTRPIGPDVVLLHELEKEYEPVPFEHRTHAKMTEMWDGCTTCHHKPPMATTQPTTMPATRPVLIASAHHTQAEADRIPACKSCHEPAGARADIRMPNLKGAYHRQCLNCHREWAAGENCGMCHKAKGGRAIAATNPASPTPDDLVARMHPPIPEPQAKVYKTRYTPADGGNVLFRHKDHTGKYAIKCVSCHYRESCSQCHADGKTGPRPLRPGKTWTESHGPCMGCHQKSRCSNCHYKDTQVAPKNFEHKDTGQALDSDHGKLLCWECHGDLRDRRQASCGPSTCHKRGPVKFPDQRPGPVVLGPTNRAGGER